MTCWYCPKTATCVAHRRSSPGDPFTESRQVCDYCFDETKPVCHGWKLLPLVLVEVGSELNVAMEVAFHVLAAPKPGWPERFCGVPHGTAENPHVWLSCKVYGGLVWRQGDEEFTEVRKDARRCPCGMLESEAEAAGYAKSLQSFMDEMRERYGDGSIDLIRLSERSGDPL